ncbi:MAG TPA: sugar-binding protein [Pyrinomonadaceae bacterium]|jgi:ribose transport system substrate-binding protein|nr:sugar-binding protein [Pyrinomonadaceae bacterium]
MRPEKSMRLICAFVCTLLLTFVLTSCQPKGTKHRLAFVTNNASPFWVIARKGTEKAAQDIPDIQVEFRIPADGTAAEQQRLVDDLLAQKIEGIAISPVDPKNQIEMLNRAAGQTLVVTQDSDAPNSNRICYIGTDNVAAGRQAGQLVKEALPNGGKIMVFVGVLDAANAAQRYQGLKEALAGSNVQIIDVRTDATDRVRAKSNASDTLVNYPDVAGMVGLWSYNGPAILSAVKEANKTDKVKIIAFDEEDETLAGVKSGEIYATVVQQPYEFGYRSMELMAKVLNGDKSGIPASKQIFVPTLAVKKDSVEQFTKELNQRLGK